MGFNKPDQNALVQYRDEAQSTSFLSFPFPRPHSNPITIVPLPSPAKSIDVAISPTSLSLAHCPVPYETKS